MNNFKPGTLHDGICFDHAVPMYGDGEGRIAPRVEEEPDEDEVPRDQWAPEGPEVPTMDMGTFFSNLNRMQRM
jgi:hypothetical protein